MKPLPRGERETRLTLSATNRLEWFVYSNDPIMHKKLDRAGAQIVRELPRGGREYRLHRKQLHFRRHTDPATLSDEQRRQVSERMAEMRRKRDGEAAQN